MRRQLRRSVRLARDGWRRLLSAVRRRSPAWRRAAATLLAVALVVAAGCAGLGELGFGERGSPAAGDEIGYEAGYWADDRLDVTTADGLNETERRAVVARTMARVEVVRGLEFEEPVPVEVISRAEYRSRQDGVTPNGTFGAWNDQVWEALLLVGEDRDVSTAFGTILGTSVQGFYSPSKGSIVLVSDSDTPMVDTRTLAHELVHALQDQHYRLSPARATQDGELAANGLTEGDANLVESIYDRRCGADWDCLERPRGAGGGGRAADFNFGVFLVIYAPYAEGPEFVDDLRQRGPGWSRVNDAYGDFPASTEQVIHPEAYPDDEPTAVHVPDRSSAEWERFGLDHPTDTVGEASLYATFWANGQVDRSRDPYNYSHPLSTGWDGDTLVPYTNGSHAGYVWKVTFDSPADAREFRDGYVRALRSRDATSPRRNVHVVPEDSPFADAFRVTLHGDTVVIVNAPTTDDLSAVHG